MKRFYFLCLSLFFLGNLFSYQPVEKDFLFNSVLKAKSESTKGSSSIIFVNSLFQFVNICSGSSKPLIIKVALRNDKSFYIYKEMAKRFCDKATFVFMDATSNAPLIKLFVNILRTDGFDVPATGIKIPLYLYCDNDFAFTQKGLFSFKRNNLKLLLPPGRANKDQVAQALSFLHNRAKVPGSKTLNQNNVNDDRKKTGYIDGLKQKIKGWFSKS